MAVSTLARRGAAFCLRYYQWVREMLTEPGQGMCLSLRAPGVRTSVLFPIRTIWSEEGIPQSKWKQKRRDMKEYRADANNSYPALAQDAERKCRERCLITGCVYRCRT